MMLSPQQQMMIALAGALDDCAKDVISGAAPDGSYSRGLSASGWRAVGRMQGIAVGCRAIAALAGDSEAPGA